MLRFIELLGVIKDLRPTFEFRNVTSVTPDFLKDHSIGGIIWDVDGTIMPYHATMIPAQLAESVNGLFGNKDFSHCILSNCDEERFLELGAILPNVPIARAYKNGSRVE